MTWSDCWVSVEERGLQENRGATWLGEKPPNIEKRLEKPKPERGGLFWFPGAGGSCWLFPGGAQPAVFTEPGQRDGEMREFPSLTHSSGKSAKAHCCCGGHQEEVPREAASDST